MHITTMIVSIVASNKYFAFLNFTLFIFVCVTWFNGIFLLYDSINEQFSTNCLNSLTLLLSIFSQTWERSYEHSENYLIHTFNATILSTNRSMLQSWNIFWNPWGGLNATTKVEWRGIIRPPYHDLLVFYHCGNLDDGPFVEYDMCVKFVIGEDRTPDTCKFTIVSFKGENVK